MRNLVVDPKLPVMASNLQPLESGYELTPPRKGLDVRNFSSGSDKPTKITSTDTSLKGSKHSNTVQEALVPVRSHSRDGEEHRTDSYREAHSEVGSGSRSPISATAVVTSGQDFPDGGLRAWLIVAGVSPFVLVFTDELDSCIFDGHIQTAFGTFAS